MRKWLRENGLRFLPALVCMGLIFFFSSMPADEVTRRTKPVTRLAPQSLPAVGGGLPVLIDWLKVGHMVGYAGLGTALLYGFEQAGKIAGQTASLLTLGVTWVYALSDELHQSFVPGRSADLRDVVIDVGAAALMVAVVEGLRFWRKKAKH
jgi:VanZ family protein